MAPADDRLNEIMRALGRLEAGQERQRADFDAEKHATSDSRRRVYEKLEHVDQSIANAADLAAQAREEAARAREEAVLLKKVVDEDIKPATDDFKRIRVFGRNTLLAVGVAAAGLGVTVASIIAAFGEGVVNTIRTWLRIP